MAEYTLYVDESTTKNFNNSFFIMGGVIINRNDYNNIEKEVIQLKEKIWNNVEGCEDYILHEKDVSFANEPLNSTSLHKVAECYKIFTDVKKVDELYNELSKIFKRCNITTIGACINTKRLYKNYGFNNINHQLSIAIQILIENYCNYLYKNNSTGNICYEFMQPNQNKQIQQRIYELKALGTLYYSPNAIQSVIREIDFQLKSANIIGLQLADFVPNSLGRFAASKKPKNKDFAKNVRKGLYCGNSNEPLKYGFKILA